MWYVLAAANALSGDADLIAGTQLKVPEMAASKNDATSFRPYNPSEIVGSTSPGLPYIPPAASNGCTYIIMAVVLIAVSIFVPPLAAAIAGPSAITVGWGATALATGIVTFGAHAVASAIGSASGMTTFSWRNSAAQGIAAGLTAGLAVKLGGTTAELIQKSAGIGKIAASAVGGALSNYAGNTIAGVKGNSFSWTAIAAASVADVATASIGNALGLVPKMVDGVKTTGNFGTDFAYSAIGGVVSLHTRRQFGFDDKVDYGAILGNAFATATGNGLARAMQGGDFLGRVPKLQAEAANDAGAKNPFVHSPIPKTGETTVFDLVNEIGLPGLTTATNANVQAITPVQSNAKIVGNQESNAVTNKLDLKVNDQLAEIIKYARSQENLGNMSSEQILDYAYKKYYHKDNPYSGQYAPVLDHVTVTGVRTTSSNASGLGPLRSGYQLASGGQSRTYLNASDRREVKRDITLSGIGGFFDGSEWFSKKLPSEFNLGVTWKKSRSIVDQLMVASGKVQAGLSQSMLELSTGVDMPKWSVAWDKSLPVLKWANRAVTFVSPVIESFELKYSDKAVTNADIGHNFTSYGISGATLMMTTLPGAVVGLTWTGLDSEAQKQHYTPLFGEHAGQEIKGWEAMYIRGNEYPEVSIRQNIQQFRETRAQATIRFETQQNLEYIRRMERAK